MKVLFADELGFKEQEECPKNRTEAKDATYQFRRHLNMYAGMAPLSRCLRCRRARMGLSEVQLFLQPDFLQLIAVPFTNIDQISRYLQRIRG